MDWNFSITSNYSYNLYLFLLINYNIFQIIIVQFGQTAFSTRALTFGQWFWCLLFGVSTLACGQIIAFIPIHRLKLIFTFIFNLFNELIDVLLV